MQATVNACELEIMTANKRTKIASVVPNFLSVRSRKSAKVSLLPSWISIKRVCHVCKERWWLRFQQSDDPVLVTVCELVESDKSNHLKTAGVR
ncbi:hypothetical protein YC2023_000314 [Brassica napus]